VAESDADKWNARYANAESTDTEPIPFLCEHITGLGTGRALVLAAGRGKNAVYLAEQGFEVTALDVSSVGLLLCAALAESRGVPLTTLCADLDNHDLGESQYDLITKFYFYEPTLFPLIRAALRPGGHFIFQTFSKNHANVGTFGPRNPAYLSDRKTVRSAFQSDDILMCEEVTLSEDDDTESVIQMLVRRT